MRYSEGKQYKDAKYGNHTAAMMPKVVAMPSIDTARRALNACKTNLRLGVNTNIYLAKIAAILAEYPQLAQE